jgi:hypothetical protein
LHSCRFIYALTYPGILIRELISDCGRYCLFPSLNATGGPKAENPWQKPRQYLRELPLSDENVSDFKECGIAQYMLEGIVGKFSNIIYVRYELPTQFNF